MTIPGSKLPRAMRRLMLSDAKETEYRACTLLYAGLAPEVRSGDWVVPWGRKGSVPEHVRDGAVIKAKVVEAVSAGLYERCREEVKQFV